MQAGQKFLDFLRKWRKNQGISSIAKSTALAPADFFVAKERENVLSKVIARHLGQENESDHDEISVQKWQSKVAHWEKEVMGLLDDSMNRLSGNNRDHFNFETSPSAHLNRFINKKKRQPDPDLLLNKPWFAQAVTAAAFALVLAIALGKMNLGLVKQINSYTDRLFVDPVIKAAFLFSSQETLAKIGIDEVPEEYRTPGVKKIIDKNVLSSFIVNNNEQLKTGPSGEASYAISSDHLDGRVAGAYEAEPSQPSLGLMAISAKPRAMDLVKARIGQALLDLANLQIKASDSAYEWLAGTK